MISILIFIGLTLKDHKPNFDNNPTCRLINPSKSEIGSVSKLILDRINTKVIEATRINQWKNTKSVLSWFNQVADKMALLHLMLLTSIRPSQLIF
jgi:hypothetical protein